MAELSIAASVTGLIGLAGSISVVLYGFFESVADAPASVRAALMVLNEMSMVLTSVQRLMSGLTNVPGRRRELIHVRHLVVIFRDLIQSFSELEATVNSLTGGPTKKARIHRLKWVLEEKKVSNCVRRIEQQKSWLSTMLLVLVCESDSEARERQAGLTDTLTALEMHYAAITNRLERLDCVAGAEQASVKFADEDRSTIRADDDTSTIRPQRPPDLPSSAAEGWSRSFRAAAYIPNTPIIPSASTDSNPLTMLVQANPNESSSTDADRAADGLESRPPSVVGKLGGTLDARVLSSVNFSETEPVQADDYDLISLTGNLPRHASFDNADQLYETTQDKLSRDDALQMNRTGFRGWTIGYTTDGIPFHFNTVNGETRVDLRLDPQMRRRNADGPDLPPKDGRRIQDDNVSTSKASSKPVVNFSKPANLAVNKVVNELLRPFARTLEQTRVYRRVQSNEADMSFTTSMVRPHAWDALSRLILADVASNVSVIALPISIQDINDIGPDLTFAKILVESQKTPSDLIWSENSRLNVWSSISPPQEIEAPLYIAVLGTKLCGKSSMIQKFTSNRIRDSVLSITSHKVEVDSAISTLQICDTHMSREYTHMYPKEAIPSNDGFLLVYDVTDSLSFKRVQQIHSVMCEIKTAQMRPQVEKAELRNKPSQRSLALRRVTSIWRGYWPVILIGNKSDATKKREIYYYEGMNLARQLGCKFFETSARDGSNIENVFCEMTRTLRREGDRLRARGRQGDIAK